MDKITQLALLSRAVTRLGGQQQTAKILEISDRSLRYLLSGERRLHADQLERISNALIAQADECRAIERQLSPAFAQNLSEAQARPRLHSGKPQPLLTRLKREMDKAIADGKKPESWLFGHSFYDQLVSETGDNIDGSGLFGGTIWGLPWESTKDENLHERGYIIEVGGQ